MSGPNSDYTGQGSVEAARLAVADFGPNVLGRPIEIVSADHQNKPDVGSAIASKWLEGGDVSAIVRYPALLCRTRGPGDRPAKQEDRAVLVQRDVGSLR